MWIYKRLWACVSELVRGLWVNPAAVVGERGKKKAPTVASYDMSTPSTSRNGPKGWNANVLIKSEGFRNRLWKEKKKEKKKEAIWLVITIGGELCKMRRASFSKGIKSSIPISAFSCPPIIHCPSETLAFFESLNVNFTSMCAISLSLLVFSFLFFFCYQKPAL